ncbi:MAG TPA: hypothetical protein PKY16_12250, partial [Gemmiger qucibialis]|nr:hypothetical protein [Gemmiger qucibialis]
ARRELCGVALEYPGTVCRLLWAAPTPGYFVSYWEPSSFTLGTCYLFNQTDPYKSWLASDLCEPFPPVFIVSSSLSTFLFRKFLFT